jgi:DnaK suppressor protein
MTMNTHAHTLRSTASSAPAAATRNSDLDATLAEEEQARQEQLDSLHDTTTDLVAIAYRDSVSRILTEIRLARRRLHEGLHHECVGCNGHIPAERIEALPWATQCTDCARRRYH